MKRIHLIVLALLTSGTCLAQQKPLFESGNAFLQNCDDSSPAWITTYSTHDAKVTQELVCTVYLLGFRQGMEVTEQINPIDHPKLSAAEKKQAEARVTEVQKLLGDSKPLMIPSSNVCIPDSVTNDQIRLVVVKWMKDHPELLNMHAAHLTFAAITSTWPCSSD